MDRLSQRDGDLLRFKDQNGHTLLPRVAEEGSKSVIQHLLELGIHPNQKDKFVDFVMSRMSIRQRTGLDCCYHHG